MQHIIINMPRRPHKTHSFQMSPSKKYIPYNTKPPKKVSHLIHSGSQSSSRHKEDVKATKADYESRIQGTIQVEIADAAGSVSMHCLTSAIPSTSTPIALKEDEEPPEDASLQQWLESMEDVVVPSDDSLMAPLLPQAPSSKSRIRTTVNWEKKSAWQHWHQNIIYQVVGIYLEVEGKRANNAPLPIPTQIVFTEDH